MELGVLWSQPRCLFLEPPVKARSAGAHARSCHLVGAVMLYGWMPPVLGSETLRRGHADGRLGIPGGHQHYAHDHLTEATFQANSGHKLCRVWGCLTGVTVHVETDGPCAVLGALQQVTLGTPQQPLLVRGLGTLERF